MSADASPSGQPRARALGVPFDGRPGPANSITDVHGVEVGYVTLIEGDGEHVVGRGPVRTGVTAVLPRGRDGIGSAVPAGWYSLNGNGEMTGTTWISETGGLNMPVLITNTHAVGSVHRGVIDWLVQHRPDLAMKWQLPVVAETWDGYLNDINGEHVRAEHAVAAIEAAHGGLIAEGSVGGGTGMNCYGYKGGSGTASREVRHGGQTFHVGAFCQANFGDREELRIAGVYLGDADVPDPMSDSTWWERDVGRAVPPGAGSVIVVVATDAPMLPGQCTALARRVPLGLARTGTTGGHFSGDIFLAFSTADAGALNSEFPQPEDPPLRSMQFVPWGQIDPFYTATVQAVEEAVVNALVVNADMTGRDGNWTPALPHDLLRTRLGLS
jgi:D-aminopeptidase